MSEPFELPPQRIAQALGRLVRERDHDGSDGWLTLAEASDVAELRAVATAMRPAHAVVMAAPTLPCSNG